MCRRSRGRALLGARPPPVSRPTGFLMASPCHPHLGHVRVESALCEFPATGYWQRVVRVDCCFEAAPQRTAGGLPLFLLGRGPHPPAVGRLLGAVPLLLRGHDDPRSVANKASTGTPSTTAMRPMTMADGIRSPDSYLLMVETVRPMPIAS